MIFRKTHAEIDLDALRKNFEYIQSSLPGRFLCPMVKANAYGHGDIVISQALESFGAKQLGVCLVEEGIRLRSGKVKTDVIVFRGFDKAAAEAMFEYKLTPVVSNFQHIEDLVSASKKFNQSIDCHVKFDTGMNRLGFDPADVDKVIQGIKKSRRLEIRGVLTHLHSGENADQKDGSSLKQLQMISSLMKNFSVLGKKGIHFHAFNSAGVAHLIHSRENPKHVLSVFEKKNNQAIQSISAPGHAPEGMGARPGLMIYGYCESLLSETKDHGQEKIQPVMTLKSQIASIRTLKKNQTVSYGGTWTAKQKSYVGVVPIGYADGYHRLNSNRAHLTLLGHQVPVIGRVCMDYLMIDLTAMLQKTRLSINHDSLYRSDVVLFGPKSKQNQISAEEVAQTSDTISWEVLTSVGERVPRVYTGSSSQKILQLVTGKRG